MNRAPSSDQPLCTIELVAQCHTERFTPDGTPMPQLAWTFDAGGTTLRITREAPRGPEDDGAGGYRSTTTEQRAPLITPPIVEPAPPPAEVGNTNGFATPWPERLPCPSFRSFELVSGAASRVTSPSPAVHHAGSEHAEPQVSWSFDAPGTAVRVVHHVPRATVAVTKELLQIEGSGRAFVAPGLEQRPEDVETIWRAVIASWKAALAQARPFHALPQAEEMLANVPNDPSRLTRIASPYGIPQWPWWQLEAPGRKGERLVVDLGPGEPDGWVEVRPRIMRGETVVTAFEFSSYGSGPSVDLTIGPSGTRTEGSRSLPRMTRRAARPSSSTPGVTCPGPRRSDSPR